jgi:hypothetical protein
MKTSFCSHIWGFCGGGLCEACIHSGLLTDALANTNLAGAGQPPCGAATHFIAAPSWPRARFHYGSILVRAHTLERCLSGCDWMAGTHITGSAIYHMQLSGHLSRSCHTRTSFGEPVLSELEKIIYSQIHKLKDRPLHGQSFIFTNLTRVPCLLRSVHNASASIISHFYNLH